ncbi:MAG TPA: mechanosensitive ion channel family protein [Jiangellaceae bacterium]|nr:mechanosensitive ion channel family protein [Jiangellaceae bacterium]
MNEPERFSEDWWADVLVDNPLKLAGLLLIALLTRYLLHRLIDRGVARAAATEPPDRLLGSRRAARVVLGGTGVYSERRALRAATLGSLLKSIVTAVIGVIVVVMAMEILGYPIGPLIASAGILGVALGFGAQNLVKDFLSGIFMLLEDQYGVGDVIDMGPASGTVEGVGLRVTRMRAIDGTVWYVRNGEVVRVGNSSHGWARAVLDVPVAYGQDSERARALVEQVAAELAADPEWSEHVLEAPEVWGVEDVQADAYLLRLVVKTEPLQQWPVARELRERIMRTFTVEGVEISSAKPE